jgi:thiazole synthase ThiGH ThiG subunit
MKKTQTEKEKSLQWLKNEIERDERNLLKDKTDFIQTIKKLKKEDIVKTKPKLTTWKKIMKILGI